MRERGIRRTPQRYSVLEYLVRNRIHATADEIFASLNRRSPLVSRATVYNALSDLSRAGLVRELVWEGKASRYDANLHAHHHFVCDHCGVIEDIDWFDIPGAAQERVAASRAVRGYQVTFHGVCKKCERRS
jgi:Fur family peroxide stress response transcriptional regulator